MKTYFIGVMLFLITVDSLILFLARGRYPLDVPFLSAFVCLNIYLCLFFGLGHIEFQDLLRKSIQEDSRRILLFLITLLLPYLIYVLGTQSFSWLPFLKLLSYMALPTMAYWTLKERSNQLHWQDVFVILALWLPLDFRWMRDVWIWPKNSLAYSFNSLLATCLGVYLFVVVRQLDRVGYRCQFSRKDWEVGLQNFLLFSLVGIPIGISTGFIAVSKHFATPWEILLSPLGIFIFIAVPEELLFRGILLNFAEKLLARPTPALVLTALIFGASHLNNGPKPDWRYFLLASIAGLFYGNAYLKTRKLMAPAIVHTLVDTVWRSFFR